MPVVRLVFHPVIPYNDDDDDVDDDDDDDDDDEDGDDNLTRQSQPRYDPRSSFRIGVRRGDRGLSLQSTIGRRIWVVIIIIGRLQSCKRSSSNWFSQYSEKLL